MTQKDRDFLKQLYKSYLVVMIGTGIILSSVYLTVEYKVIYHFIAFIYLYQGHETRPRAFCLI